MNKIENANAKVWYGMHFYPGVAEYAEPNKSPLRVFINESTMRKMDPSFAGRPIFVEHVDDVNPNLSELRKEADGWVVESFFNKADGKHWAKFLTVSEYGENAIKGGMRLSNAYIPKSYAQGGLWNGVKYDKEIVDGEFEHLALVRNPRYEESVILTPEDFKKYNLEKEQELKRLANSKGDTMALNFFKKQKVENALDEGMSVMLPKSKIEKTILQLVNEADEKEEKMKVNDGLADLDHKVKLHDGSVCNVAELVEKHKALHDELAAMKKEKEGVVDDDAKKKNDEEELKKKNAEDAEAKKKALELAEHEEKEIEAAKKKNALEAEALKKKQENFDKLKNAHLTVNDEVALVDLMEDQVARGRSRYGSTTK